MNLVKKLRIRHLIDDSWVCEFNRGRRFIMSDWVGVSVLKLGDGNVAFSTYEIGTNSYYNHCRGDYENAVQTQLKVLASRGMEMGD